MTTQISYDKLESEDGSLLGENEHYRPAKSSKGRLYVTVASLMNICLLAASLLCLRLSFLDGRLKTIRDQDILRQTTFYSPMIETMSPGWGAKQYVTYPVDRNESILRQPPSAEVDAYWDRISSLGMMPIGAEQIKSLGKDPSTVMKAPEDWGMGSDAYLVQLDGLHLLHCLNSMRKNLHYNYPFYHQRGHSAAYLPHLSHCQEALAHWLMCQPSLDLIKFDWVENHSRPFPDFDITRKCIDFEGLLAWQEDHRVQDDWLLEHWKTMEMPHDVVPRKSPILNDEEKSSGGWVSLEDSYKGKGMPQAPANKG